MVVTSPPRVCVIGGGPGGMFFCHALETKRQELAAQGDEAGLSSLPTVTCFERAPAPGGVWRSERTFASASVHREDEKKDQETPMVETTNMYEALWTNGPKENIEFFDYTFQDHFGEHSLPVYMPRQPILDYLIGRVTTKCPDFFEKYMTFNTNVESVQFVESKQKFDIVTRDMRTGEQVKQDYDYCVWSGGENGRPMMPGPLVNLFQAGGFPGRIIHSTDTANFEKDTKGKRVLIIGGSYSAEDLALMAIKVDAEKVYISSRDKDNAVYWSGAWPENKVQVLDEETPVGVTENGRCIQFAKAEWTFPDNFTASKDDITTEIRDIDTIIFCTGYRPNVEMLDKDLRQALACDVNLKLPIPQDWKMKPNKLTEIVGDVEPGDVWWIQSSVSFPGLYRGHAITNPAMMFITTAVDANPITGVDVCSRLLLKHITTGCQLPSQEEMIRENEQDALIAMDNPYFRVWMDENYHEAFNAKWEELKHPESMKLLYEEYEKQGYDIYARYLARDAREAGYPVDFGSLEELSEASKTILKYDELSYEHRTKLTTEDAENRRTFRDYNDGEKFCSLYTGAKAVPLKHLWLDMEASDPSILE